MATKKYITLDNLSTFLGALKQAFSMVGHTHNVSDVTDYKIDDSLSATSVNPVQNKVIDAEFEAINDAMSEIEAEIDAINESVSNSKADWNEEDENSLSYIYNKPAEMNEDDMLELLVELGAVDPISTIDNIIYTNSSDQIYIL